MRRPHPLPPLPACGGRVGRGHGNSCGQEDTAMTNNKFTVGIKVDGTRHSVTVMAEDALVAALKVKLEQPAASINFVRRCNRRGDLRHPPEDGADRRAGCTDPKSTRLNSRHAN